MNLKKTLLGTFAYTFVTFPLAICWHVLFFEALYRAFGYFEGEPSFLLGLLAILMQGFILSLLLPFVQISGKPVFRGLKYALILGLFFWTSHVLTFVAKQDMNEAWAFVAMESLYLILQFGIYGALIGLISGAVPEQA